MVEYLYDVVKAISGEDINICAEITDAEGTDITSGCSLLFIDKEFNTIAEYKGIYADGAWTFTIPAETTKCMEGRYWYRIKFHDGNLCFAAPIYIGR